MFQSFFCWICSCLAVNWSFTSCGDHFLRMKLNFSSLLLISYLDSDQTNWRIITMTFQEYLHMDFLLLLCMFSHSEYQVLQLSGFRKCLFGLQPTAVINFTSLFWLWIFSIVTELEENNCRYWYSCILASFFWFGLFLEVDRFSFSAPNMALFFSQISFSFSFSFTFGWKSSTIFVFGGKPLLFTFHL